MLPATIENFYKSLLGAMDKITAMKVMGEMNIVSNDKMQEITTAIDMLNGRLDNLTNVMGKLLENQMNEYIRGRGTDL